MRLIALASVWSTGTHIRISTLPAGQRATPPSDETGHTDMRIHGGQNCLGGIRQIDFFLYEFIFAHADSKLYVLQLVAS